MPFFVCDYNYLNQTSRTLYKCNTLTNAQLEIEDMLFDIQYGYQGEKKYVMSRNELDINKLKYGMFVHNKTGDRYTIYFRNRMEGYLYHSYKDERVLDLFIVEIYECPERDERTYFGANKQYGIVLRELVNLAQSDQSMEVV